MKYFDKSFAPLPNCLAYANKKEQLIKVSLIKGALAYGRVDGMKSVSDQVFPELVKLKISSKTDSVNIPKLVQRKLEREAAKKEKATTK